MIRRAQHPPLLRHSADSQDNPDRPEPILMAKEAAASSKFLATQGCLGLSAYIHFYTFASETSQDGLLLLKRQLLLRVSFRSSGYCFLREYVPISRISEMDLRCIIGIEYQSTLPLFEPMRTMCNLSRNRRMQGV